MNETHRPLAFITGASSGIGAEFARQLAAAGYDLILVARRASRLEELAATLSRTHNVQVEWFTADLATEAGISAVAARIVDLPRLDLLINNAGFGTGGAFAEADVNEQAAMLTLHMMAPMRLSHAALAGMLARRSGGIINVASLAGFMVLPGSANYCATKAYLATFSQALAAEVRRHGVRVQALCPGFTITEFHDRPDQGGFDRKRIPRFAWGSARAVVAESLRSLARGQVVCVPGFLNRLILFFARTGLVNLLAPAFLGRRM